MAVLGLLAACSGDAGNPRPISSPVGPPEIQPDVVAQHAAQFEDDLPQRPAGSQQEFAAATYITAHLQQAGYVVELDAVPVEDLVRSSNVIALPPSGEKPEIVVTVAYDTGRTAGSATTIGTFLELARALRVAVPDHSVEFVALGAELTEVNGGSLGSRRLIKVFLDEGVRPEIVVIVELRDDIGAQFAAANFESRLIRLPLDKPDELLDFLEQRSQ